MLSSPTQRITSVHHSDPPLITHHILSAHHSLSSISYLPSFLPPPPTFPAQKKSHLLASPHLLAVPPHFQHTPITRIRFMQRVPSPLIEIACSSMTDGISLYGGNWDLHRKRGTRIRRGPTRDMVEGIALYGGVVLVSRVVERRDGTKRDGTGWGGMAW